MGRQVMYIGVDVDDKYFHVSGINGSTGEVIGFKCKANVSTLVGKLKKVKTDNVDLKLCYEATYLGFSLCRKLRKLGFHCDVIAPSLVPTASGKRVKTDRIDAEKLARFYMKDLLTIVHMPDDGEERVRDLIRSRRFLTHQIRNLKCHILSLCRRHDINYKEHVGKSTASYWCRPHLEWLQREVVNMKDKNLSFNLNLLLHTLRHLQDQADLYEQQIEHIAETDKYQHKNKALCCYRGISTLTAMTLITELGDINRFDHPKKLASYAGLDLSEYSSGGREKRFGITKTGNKRIRTAVVESCQLSWKPPQVGLRLKDQRKNVDPKLVSIADRCMHRLYKKSVRMMHAGKPKNKIKIATARELLCFVWESLKAVA